MPASFNKGLFFLFIYILLATIRLEGCVSFNDPQL